MALSGLANKRLVAALRLAGVRAVGLSGEDGPLLLADVLAGGTLGAVGEVRTVDTTLITTLVAAGYLPVIAPVAALYIPGVGPGAEAHAARRAVAIPDAATSALNINGDDAASAVAVALGAAELLLVSDVAGVRIDGKPAAELTPAMAERAIADGEIAGGMVAKVRAALGAIECGVPRVRIGTLELLDGSDRGTVVATSRARLAHASTSQGAAA
jgi:acetylglutamate kinase